MRDCVGGLCFRVVLSRSFALSRRVSLSVDKVVRQNKKAVKTNYTALYCLRWFCSLALWGVVSLVVGLFGSVDGLQDKRKAGQGRAPLRFCWLLVV